MMSIRAGKIEERRDVKSLSCHACEQYKHRHEMGGLLTACDEGWSSVFESCSGPDSVNRIGAWSPSGNATNGSVLSTHEERHVVVVVERAMYDVTLQPPRARRGRNNWWYPLPRIAPAAIY